MRKTFRMLLKTKGFKFVITLDLNMGYYHIQLSKDEINLCTIIFL